MQFLHAETILVVHYFLLAVSKPRPPSNLVYGPKIDNSEVFFGLNFSPDPAYSSSQRRLTYKVRTQSYLEPNQRYYEYTCTDVAFAVDERNRAAMDLPVEAYVEHTNGYKVHMEVAAMYGGVASRYVSFPENGNNESCKIPVVIGE